MSTEKSAATTDPAQEELAVSRAELHIEREKIEIERERLALERERLSAERERWKTDSELQSRAEGRGIAVSTLVFVAVICILAGIIAGFLSVNARASRSSTLGLEALTATSSTNAPANGKSVFLRPVETGGGSKAYLLIVE
jgi:hypothetical protein